MRSYFFRFLSIILFSGTVSTLLGQNIQWQNSLGGSYYDEGVSIQRTDDGGYISLGKTTSSDGDVSGFHGGSDIWVVKLNSMGDTSWTKALGGTDSEGAGSIRQTMDGGYILCGRTNSVDGDVSGNNGDMDYWVVKLNNSGDTVWTQCLGGSNSENAYDIQQTIDSGYVVAGVTRSTDGYVSGNQGGDDWWIVKLNSNGDTIWTKVLGGSSRDEAYSIQQTSDSGYVVAGESESNDGYVTGHHGTTSFEDFWVVKLNSNGDTIWTHSLGGSYSELEPSVKQTNDGGYFVAGRTVSNDGDVSGNNGGYDHWLIKLDSAGKTLWTQCLGGPNDEGTRSIGYTSDGGYVIAGDISRNGENDYWVVKLDSSFDTTWTRSFGSPDNDLATSIQETSDSAYVVTGLVNLAGKDVVDFHGYEDQWVVKFRVCTTYTSSIAPTTCDSFTVPSGDETYTTSGNYIDTLQNQIGCDSLINIDLTVDSVDTAVEEIGPTTLKAMDSSAHYQWLDCDSDHKPINGATNQTFTATSNGNYALEVTQNGCKDTSGCYSMNSVGLVEDQLNGRVRARPNPTKDKVRIEVPFRKEPLDVTVRDASGRKVKQERVTDPSKFRIGLGKKPGMYWIELRDESGKTTMIKVLKE